MITQSDRIAAEIDAIQEKLSRFPYTFKPFGGKEYSYTELYQIALSWTIWALVTYSSVKINTLEGIGVTAASLAMNEKSWGLEGIPVGGGASYAHNIQAGYCWYHYFVKGNQNGFWGAWAELIGNLGCVGQEFLENKSLYSHIAHYRGATYGMSIAFVLDMLRGAGFPKLGRWALAPLLTIAAMKLKHETKKK